MIRCNLFFVGLVALMATFAAAMADAACNKDRQRGIAILSPLDSPDICDPGVGGAPRFVPYYRGYVPGHGCRMHTRAGAGFGYSYSQQSTGELRGRPTIYPAANYGGYSGARHDEANLLHLGGFSSSDHDRDEPCHYGTEDLRDQPIAD